MVKSTKQVIKNGPAAIDSPAEGVSAVNPMEATSGTAHKGQGTEGRETEETLSNLSSEVSSMDIDSHETDSMVSKGLTSEPQGHYHYVPTGNDSRELFGRSTRVDTDSVYPKTFILEENGHLGSDKRRHLSNEIARLKHELYNCVIQGIAHDETSEEAKRLTATILKLEKAEKAYTLLFGHETTLVPSETPLFQWKGHVFNKSKHMFPSVEDCLDQFERVIFAHRMSLEDNWRRLVPARMSTSMARWYSKQLENGTFGSWSNFRTAVSNKYGKSQEDVKEEARKLALRQKDFVLFVHGEIPRIERPGRDHG